MGPALLWPSVSTVEDGCSIPCCGVTVSTSCLGGSHWAWVKVHAALQQGSAAALLGLVPITCSGCNQNHADGLEDEVKEPGLVRLGCSSTTNKQTEGELALPSCFPGLLYSEAVPGAWSCPMWLEAGLGDAAGTAGLCVGGRKGDSSVLMKQMAGLFPSALVEQCSGQEMCQGSCCESGSTL